MLAESKKDSIRKAVNKLIKLDSAGMMIIMSNATALLARKELEESRIKQPIGYEPESVKKMADPT